MKPLYLFRHIACEGPGYLGVVLQRHGVPWQEFHIDAGDAIPESIDAASGLVFMGGPMSVNDPLPWIEQELQLIRAAQQAGLPVLGHCLGGQLISKALGGVVTRNPVKEIGWHAVRTSAGAGSARWLGDLQAENTLFHWHGETFSLPPGAERILGNANCANQGFVIGNTLALQCHVEMTAPMVQEWAALYAEEIASPAGAVQSAAEITRDLATRIPAAQAVADTLYTHWLRAVQR